MSSTAFETLKSALLSSHTVAFVAGFSVCFFIHNPNIGTLVLAVISCLVVLVDFFERNQIKPK